MKDMFLYRDHIGTLEDSMHTVQEMQTLKELEKYVISVWGPGSIKVEYYGEDPRIQWRTYVVTHKNRAIGFTNALQAPEDGRYIYTGPIS